MGVVVCYHWKPCYCYRVNELFTSRGELLLTMLLLTLNAVCLRSDCLLWTKHSLDYHRLYPLLPQMEATAHQGPYSCRTMGMY